MSNFRCSRALDATEDISVHLVSLEELRSIVLEGKMIQALHAAPVLRYLMQLQH